MRRKEASNDHSTSCVVTIDIETIVPNPPTNAGDGFAKWPNHQPVVASLLGATALGEGQFGFWLDSFVLEPGREAAFYTAVDERIPPYGTLLGFNSRGFDIPVLAIGAAAARVTTPNLAKMHRAYRHGPLHADLADLQSGFGAATKPSLTEICGRLGVPVKVSTHGSEVAELHAAGRIDEIVRYCESDVAATYAAWLHWAAWRDGSDALVAEPLAAFSRWIETSSDQFDHLLPVARCGPARWARARGLALSLDHARIRIERRARQERDERAFRGEVVLVDNDDDDLIF